LLNCIKGLFDEGKPIQLQHQQYYNFLIISLKICYYELTQIKIHLELYFEVKHNYMSTYSQ